MSIFAERVQVWVAGRESLQCGYVGGGSVPKATAATRQGHAGARGQVAMPGHHLLNPP
jgi:hypothetical protein